MFDLKLKSLGLKRILKYLCVGLALFLLLPSAAMAASPEGEWHNIMFTGDSAKSGDYVVLESSKTVKGPAFYSGNKVEINGNVDGTAFVAGQEVTINGDIKGDLFAAGQEVTITGKIYGNLYAAGQKVLVKGQVTGDAFIAGEKAETAGEAVFNRDLMVGAQSVNQLGPVERQMFAVGGHVVLNGRIGDNARLTADNLEVQDGALIKGKLVYLSPKQASVSEKAKIGEGTEWKKAAPRQQKEQKTFVSQLLGVIIGILGALLVWFIGITVKQNFWIDLIRPIGSEPVKTIGIGALTLIMVPILAIILMVTVVGLPVGILLVLAYGITLYLAKIISAVFIGNWLAARFNWPTLHRGVWLVLLGLAIIAVVTRIPFVGFLFTLAIVFAGLGAVAMAIVKPQSKI